MDKTPVLDLKALIDAIDSQLTQQPQATVATNVRGLVMTNNDFGGLPSTFQNVEDVTFQGNTNSGRLRIDEATNFLIDSSHFSSQLSQFSTETLQEVKSELEIIYSQTAQENQQPSVQASTNLKEFFIAIGAGLAVEIIKTGVILAGAYYNIHLLLSK